MQRRGRHPVKNERLTRQLRDRSPDGTRRPTTDRPERNLLVVDLGEDAHGLRPALEALANQGCRSVSSVVREILKRTLIDFQVRP